MRQRQRGDFQIANRERPVHHARFGNEIALRPRAVVKSVSKDALQITHGRGAGVDRQRSSATQVAKPPAIIQPHDVVGVRVGEKDRVEPVDSLAQTLQAEFRRRIDHEPGLVGGDVNRGPGPMVFWIGQEFRGIVLADDRHPLRGARTKKNKRERHEKI